MYVEDFRKEGSRRKFGRNPFSSLFYYLGGGKRGGWRFAYIGSTIVLDLNIRKGCWEGRFSFRTFAIFVFILGDGKFNILLL